MESMLAFDRELMVLFNLSGSHTPFLDGFFWMVSQILIWLPAVLMMLFVITKDKGREAFLIVFSIALVFVLGDQISASVIKPAVARLRPGRDPAMMEFLEYVNNYRGGAFSFPSSHATNSFAFAVFSLLLFKNKAYSIVVLLWAAFCSYSRLYLGVHYPFDVLCGSLLGALIGWFCYYFYHRLRVWFPKYKVDVHHSGADYTPSGYRKANVYLILFSLFAVMFSILCFAIHIKRFVA